MTAASEIQSELKTLGIQLKLLGTNALIAVSGRNEEALARIIDRRDEVLARIQQLAVSHRDAVLNCAELIEAAEQEAAVLSLVRPRREELLQEWQSIQQRLALRRMYQSEYEE